MVSEGMRTILWDLDWNAGDMPFKFDCLLLFSLFFFLPDFENFLEAISFLPTDSGGEEDKRLY